MIKKCITVLKNHIFSTSIIVTLIVSIIISIGTFFVEKDLEGFFILSFLIALFVIYPIVLTLIEVILLLHGRKDVVFHNHGRIIDVLCIGLGIPYTGLYLSIIKGVTSAEWSKAIYYDELHSPIAPAHLLTVVVIIGIAIVGYLIANFTKLQKTPPLLIVLAMSGMYIGSIYSMIWLIQIFPWGSLTLFDFVLILLPLDCEMITIRTLMLKMKEWNEIPHTLKDTKGRLNQILMKSGTWPIAAFLLMWPMLFILMLILILFGQEPMSMIKAFTETSDWNLSQQIAPQSIIKDEHYLCTVAAGGHRKVVKPNRMGIRHGHQVIVNRQLCVANAFEQVLEEKTPCFHRALRNFYDTYGFPIAKLIHSKYLADMVYIFMKPLEWFFIIVLYLVDVNPEDRIAIQYTGKRMGDFKHEI